VRGRWTLCDRKSVLYLLMRWRLCCQGISRYNTDHMYNLSYIHCIYVIIMDIYQLDDVIIWITISNLTIEHYKGWYSKPQIKRAPKMWMYGGNHWERAQIELRLSSDWAWNFWHKFDALSLSELFLMISSSNSTSYQTKASVLRIEIVSSWSGFHYSHRH